MNFTLFQVLQIFDPGVRCVVQTEIEEDADKDEEEAKDPVEYLNRQLRRIRRGEAVERLKIRLR